MRQRLFLIPLLLFVYSCAPERTQEPKAPYPYGVEEVSFISVDGKTKLSGTLTQPKSRARFAVILISGSGPQDRDYTNQFGHRPFLVLADYLTRNGITVLRYDERGVGKSSGDFQNASYDDLATDAAGALKFLRSTPNDYHTVGIIGHSEGGGMAPLVAQKVKADFLVLMAPDNSPARESLLHQTDARLQSMEVEETTRQEILAGIDSILSIARRETSPAIAKSKMMEIVERRNATGSDRYKEVSARLGDPERFIDGCLDPKFVYRLHHDPKEELSKVNVPVLVLYGDDDHALDVKTNLPLIEKALEYTWHDVKIFPGVGHLFMKSKGVEMSDLDDVEETIAPEVLETITEWIKQDSVRRRLSWIGFQWEERKDIVLYISEPRPHSWYKMVIAKFQKDGKLRIRADYRNPPIYLEPVNVSPVTRGDWSGTFRNDSLEVQLSATLEKDQGHLSLSGFGTLTLKSPKQTTRDSVYFVKE
jgi:pimeloyl-ACP methyl ester carboxylesterase